MHSNCYSCILSHIKASCGWGLIMKQDTVLILLQFYVKVSQQLQVPHFHQDANALIFHIACIDRTQYGSYSSWSCCSSQQGMGSCSSCSVRAMRIQEEYEIQRFAWSICIVASKITLDSLVVCKDSSNSHRRDALYQTVLCWCWQHPTRFPAN